jgi:hypothetical protein
MVQAARRYFMVVGAILLVLAAGAFVTKPKPGAMKRGVEEAMAAYASARAAAPVELKELPLPTQIEEHDWILARSYTAKRSDGATFWCWGVSVVTVCDAPD